MAFKTRCQADIIATTKRWNFCARPCWLNTPLMSHLLMVTEQKVKFT